MSITRQLNSKSNISQFTDADRPTSLKQPVIARMAPTDSTASQTVINLPFPVDTINAQDSFFLAIDGKVLSIGSANDYTMTAIDSLGFSSQATLTSSLSAGLNIQAWKLGLKKELEFAQDQRFVSAYDYLDKGFQGFIDTSILMTPTTATGAPAAGTFYSSITGRASMVDLRQDLKPRMGIERIMTQQISQLQNEFGPSGENVYGVLNDTLNQIRFVGAGWTNNTSTYGALIFSSIVGDYVEITFHGTGLNLLSMTTNDTRNFQASVDGGALGSNILPGSTGSTVLNARNYSQNSVFSVFSGLSLGIHTVRIQVTAVSPHINGFEILNESSLVKTNPGIGYAQGKKALLAAQASSSYNDVVTGIRGGRVLQYLSAAGVVSKAWQAVDSAQLNLTSADHTNEEVARTTHFREFGAGRADDFSSLTSTASDRAFTLDDGTTSLVGKQSRATGSNPDGVNIATGTANFITLTFIGTGLDIQTVSGSQNITAVSVDAAASIGALTNTSGTQKIVSGLPYGTHTVKFSGNAANDTGQIVKFIVYQPKKPTLASGAIELADYNVMADFIANTTAAINNIATGVMRKVSEREMVYVGASWSIAASITTSVSGWQTLATTNGDYVEYRFFGTGFDFRHQTNTDGATAQININSIAATTANYPSATFSYYGNGSFASGTGVLTQTGTLASGSGIRVSGLPVGSYVVRVSKTGGTNFRVDAFDIITPIYSTKSNLYADLQNTLSVGSNAISDNRKTTPVKDILPVTKAWAQALGITSGPTTSTATLLPCPDMSLTIKTSGGVLDIMYGVSASMGSATSMLFQVYVDGVAVGNGKVSTSTTSGDIETLADRIIVPVAAGVHKVDLYWANAGAGTVTGFGTSRSLTVKEL